MSRIRTGQVTSVTIASGAAESGAFDFSDASGLSILMPAAWTSASLGFKVCNTIDGTFVELRDADNAIVQISSPEVSLKYSAPIELFAEKFVKLWSQDGSSNDTNQGAERVLFVTLKA